MMYLGKYDNISSNQMSRAILRSPIRFLKTNGYYLEDRHWSSIFFLISRRYSNHVRQFFPEKSKNLTWYCTTLWHARIKSTWSTSQSVFKYPSTASIAHYLYATRFKRYTNFLLFFTKKYRLCFMSYSLNCLCLFLRS